MSYKIKIFKAQMSTRNFKIIKQLLSILKLGVYAKYYFFGICF